MALDMRVFCEFLKSSVISVGLIGWTTFDFLIVWFFKMINKYN